MKMNTFKWNNYVIKPKNSILEALLYYLTTRDTRNQNRSATEKKLEAEHFRYVVASAGPLFKQGYAWIEDLIALPQEVWVT